MLPAPKLGIESESRIPQISADNLDDAGEADYDASMRWPDPEFVKDPRKRAKYAGLRLHWRKLAPNKPRLFWSVFEITEELAFGSPSDLRPYSEILDPIISINSPAVTSKFRNLTDAAESNHLRYLGNDLCRRV